MKLLYDVIYKHFKAPWDSGPRRKLVELVEMGDIKPGRALDLGSGTGSNAIYLAENGFDAVGIDFSEPAVEIAKKRSNEKGVTVQFYRDDLTNLSRDYGKFDLLIDYGTFDDLPIRKREKYLENILPLAEDGAQYLLFVFEWPLRWWEKWNNYHMALERVEVQAFFGKHFAIENTTECSTVDYKRWPAGYNEYLMVRT